MGHADRYTQRLLLAVGTDTSPVGRARLCGLLLSRERTGSLRAYWSPLAVVSGALGSTPLKQRAMTVSTADGRAIHVVVAGAEHGTPVVNHDGTPGSAYPYPPFVEAATERGLRHVEYSRPGYAGSDRHPGRRVADCALDLAVILDALGAERCYTHGVRAADRTRWPVRRCLASG